MNRRSERRGSFFLLADSRLEGRSYQSSLDLLLLSAEARRAAEQSENTMATRGVRTSFIGDYLEHCESPLPNRLPSRGPSWAICFTMVITTLIPRRRWCTSRSYTLNSMLTHLTARNPSGNSSKRSSMTRASTTADIRHLGERRSTNASISTVSSNTSKNTIMPTPSGSNLPLDTAVFGSIASRTISRPTLRSSRSLPDDLEGNPNSRSSLRRSYRAAQFPPFVRPAVKKVEGEGTDEGKVRSGGEGEGGELGATPEVNSGAVVANTASTVINARSGRSRGVTRKRFTRLREWVRRVFK